MIVIVIFAPIIVGLTFAFVQLGLYKTAVLVFKLPRERVPIFPILLMRGLIGALVIILSGTIIAAKTGDLAEDPMLPPAIREHIRQENAHAPQDLIPVMPVPATDTAIDSANNQTDGADGGSEMADPQSSAPESTNAAH